MKIVVHLPRASEATVQHNDKPEGDITIKPRVYAKNGLVNVLHFSVANAKGETDRYVVTVSAANKGLRLQKLVEVVPACDEDAEEKK